MQTCTVLRAAFIVSYRFRKAVSHFLLILGHYYFLLDFLENITI